MEKIHKLNIITCRSQVRNPAGLRRFPSPHPSFFSKFLVEFLGSNEEEIGVGAYIEGGLSPPLGRPGYPPYISIRPHIPSSFEPKNSTKNPEKKREGEEKGSSEALPDCALVICR